VFRGVWRHMFAWHGDAAASGDPAGLAYRENWFAEMAAHLVL
jgi:hypothetical protein